MSSVYCQVCQCRPILASCDWCKIQTCKSCTRAHACEAASMDMNQFVDEIKDLVLNSMPPAPKETRENNMEELPLYVLEHLQQENKIIDDYYIKRSKELEERNASLDGELKNLHNKFLELETEYKTHITNLTVSSHQIGAAHDVKLQEIVDTYNKREKQFTDHIKLLENQNNQLIAQIQALQTPKPVAPQKKQTIKPRTTF